MKSLSKMVIKSSVSDMLNLTNHISKQRYQVDDKIQTLKLCCVVCVREINLDVARIQNARKARRVGMTRW